MRRALFALVLCGVSALGPITAAAQVAPPDIPPFAPSRAGADSLDAEPGIRHPVRAFAEFTGVNLLVWSYNRYLREGGGEGFKTGWTAWNENLENGFDWDPNNFSTNQWAHPFHGSLYYNAARSNGYTFWESMGVSFAGSFQWEFLGESRHPSINDWVNTSVGGASLGEMTHRLAAEVRDNSATGAGRVGREIAGLAIDPVGGVTRILSGEWGRVEPPAVTGPPPSALHMRMRFGARTVYDQEFNGADTTGAFLQAQFAYGSPFQPRFRRPYDHFTATVQVNFNDRQTLGQVTVAGMLARRHLAGGAKAEHVLAAYQHYDYLNNRAFELGGQSFSAGVLSRFGTPSPKYRFETALQLTGVLLGATKSDYENQTSRSYDYGPGYGVRFAGAFSRDTWDILRIGYYDFFLFTVNGNRGKHRLRLTFLGASVPLGRAVALGGEYQLYVAERQYADFPQVNDRSPQLQLFARAQF